MAEPKIADLPDTHCPDCGHRLGVDCGCSCSGPGTCGGRTYADAIADMPVNPGEHEDTRTLGTLMFATSWALEFVLEPETWPVFAAWYAAKRAQWGQPKEPPGVQARTELQDMLGELRAIGLAGEL